MPDKYLDSIRRAATLGKRAVRFARREPRHVLLIGQMAWWVVRLSLAVKILPLPRALNTIMLMMPSTSSPRSLYQSAPALSNDKRHVSDERAVQLLDALLGANLFVFTPSCWKRSVVLYRFFAARDGSGSGGAAAVDMRVRFGVRKEISSISSSGGGRFEGHAWLEVGGVPVFEKVAPDDYRITFSFPA